MLGPLASQEDGLHARSPGISGSRGRVLLAPTLVVVALRELAIPRHVSPMHLDSASGDFFGEEVLVGTRPRSATVEAATGAAAELIGYELYSASSV